MNGRNREWRWRTRSGHGLLELGRGGSACVPASYDLLCCAHRLRSDYIGLPHAGSHTRFQSGIPLGGLPTIGFNCATNPTMCFPTNSQIRRSSISPYAWASTFRCATIDRQGIWRMCRSKCFGNMIRRFPDDFHASLNRQAKIFVGLILLPSLVGGFPHDTAGVAEHIPQIRSIRSFRRHGLPRSSKGYGDVERGF